MHHWLIFYVDPLLDDLGSIEEVNEAMLTFELSMFCCIIIPK